MVFDSKLTTCANHSKLHNELQIAFITLRRRTAKLLAEVANLPRSAWKTAHLDVPHRKLETPRIVDQRVEAHNPLLLDAGRIGPTPTIPWWGGRALRIDVV